MADNKLLSLMNFLAKNFLESLTSNADIHGEKASLKIFGMI